MNINSLRKKHPQFVYKEYRYKVSDKDLIVSFVFEISPSIRFTPKVTIKNIKRKNGIDNLVFHLGLIEMLSYWKATCSPEIVIEAGSLSKEQVKWWHDLIIKGMGQFFYENKINFKQPDFLKISCPQAKTVPLKLVLRKRTLIPVGDGKDSLTTLEIFRKHKKPFNCFCLSPTAITKKIIKKVGSKTPIIVSRKIDKKLLALNQAGYLNGHTPFSAYLAFLSVLCAVIFDYKHIAFSNERSANEGNTEYLGETINHQYSKTFSFEKKFRSYSRKHLVNNIEYFSFLRPLYEIQIANIFAGFPQYFSLFLSCNEARKTDSGRKKTINKWCGNCSKCLFVLAILYPFVPKKEIINIFGKNLFTDKKLLPIMRELIEADKVKPLECVGTKKESLLAFYLSWQKEEKAELPFLLDYFAKNILPKQRNLDKQVKIMLNSWDKQNNLPLEFIKLLKLTKKLNQV